MLSVFQSIATAIRFGRTASGNAGATYLSLHQLVSRLRSIEDSHYLFEASLEDSPSDHRLLSSDDEKNALVIVASLLVTQILRSIQRKRPTTPELAEVKQHDVRQLSAARDVLSEHLPQPHSSGFYEYPSLRWFWDPSHVVHYGDPEEVQRAYESEQKRLRRWIPFSEAAHLAVSEPAIAAKPRWARAPYRERVYYGTDREISFADGVPHYSDSGIPSEEATYGKCVVTLPPHHREGIVETPSGDADFDAQKHVVVESNTALDAATFASGLRNALADSASSDMFLFIHGAATSFDQAIKRAAQIRLDTKFRGSAVAYSWPSQGDFTAYGADYDRVNGAATQAKAFIERLVTISPGGKIHVIAHSLGCLIAAQAISALSPTASKAIYEVILGAPDISSIDYPKLADALGGSARRVTVYSAPSDRALLVSATVRKGIRRAGADVQLAAHIGVDAIDASAVVKKSWFGDRHSYIFEAALVSELRAVLEGMPQLRPFLDERILAPQLKYYVLRRRS